MLENREFTIDQRLLSVRNMYVVKDKYGQQLTLPQTAIAGTISEFAVTAAGQQLQVDPGAAGAIYINGAMQADDAYIWADDEGESVKLVCDGNHDWIAIYTQGTWSARAKTSLDS